MKLTCGEFVGLAYANDDELREFAEEILAENTKLRELCTALYRCRDKISKCATCEDVACPFTDDCMLHARMRELGIEVTA